MAEITFKGMPVHTNGVLPEIGAMAPNFRGVKSDLSELSLSDLKGKRVVLMSLKTAIKNQTEYPRITCLEVDTK